MKLPPTLASLERELLDTRKVFDSSRKSLLENHLGLDLSALKRGVYDLEKQEKNIKALERKIKKMKEK